LKINSSAGFACLYLRMNGINREYE